MVPVVLYHAGFGGVAGGYVGVDVFFVISGFLITSILQREIQEERYSIVRFYERRVRRLLPALMTVMLVCCSAAALMLPPLPFKDFAQSVAATSVFSSNILFFMESGYFDAAAEAKPLLHTWSLAVEEQFYLLYPLLLGVLVRNRVALPSLLILTAISFVACIVATRYSQPMAFFLLPFRAWELGLGALIALLPATSNSSRIPPDAIRFVGLVLILGSVVHGFSPDDFPGWVALIPCAGAAMIIAAGTRRPGMTFRLLSSSGFVFVGKISYSLYLWHWPVFVFASMAVEGGRLDPYQAFLAVVVSFCLAVASWIWIEGPFRNKSLFNQAPKLFSAALTSSAAFVLLGAIGHGTVGLPQRLSSEALAFANAGEDFSPSPPTCGNWEKSDRFCLIGKQDQKPEFVFVGDSHAGILSNGVHYFAKGQNVSGIYSGVGGCPPLFGIEKDESVADSAADSECTARNEELRRLVSDDSSEIRVAILAARWAYYAEGRGTGLDQGNIVKLTAPNGSFEASGTQRAIFEKSLISTVKALEDFGLTVYVLEQVPEFPVYSSSNAVRSLILGGEGSMEKLAPSLIVPLEAVRRRQRAFEAAIASPDFPSSASIVRTRQLFCSAYRCEVTSEGIPRYFDNNHVTTRTAMAIGKLLEPVFDSLPPNQLGNGGSRFLETK